MAAKSCAPTDRGQGVLRRGHAQFATLEIAHWFVPDSMLAFSALRNTENGPPFVARRDSVRLPSFQCGPCVSRSLLCRLLAVAGRRQPVAADAKQHALTLVKRVAGQVKPDPKLPFAIETTIRQLDRYCAWRTEANGFFPGAASDLSLPAAELKALRAAWMERIGG